jgi:hypothetical protein
VEAAALEGQQLAVLGARSFGKDADGSVVLLDPLGGVVQALDGRFPVRPTAVVKRQEPRLTTSEEGQGSGGLRKDAHLLIGM